MSEQNYCIKYNSMDQLLSSICTKIEQWHTDLSNWAASYNKIVEMDSFQGTAANSAKTYMQEVHGVLLYSIQQAMTSFQSEFLLYKTGYYDIEGNIYSTISQETVTSVTQRLYNESTNVENIFQSIQSSLNSVSDIFVIGNPSKYTLQDTMNGLKRELSNFNIGIDNYEETQYSAADKNVKSLLDALQKTINDYYENGTNIATYQSGNLAGNTNVLELYDKVQTSSEHISEKQEEISAAAEKQEEVYVQMQKDYEAACEARKDEGTAQMIMGGVTVFIGVVAIVGTMGMATPIVATAAVAGTCSVAYGVSNAVEGAQDYYYGSVGDLSSEAINPIRDTVFAGNQTVYDAWGNLSVTVAGLCIPVGQAVNGVAGASTNVLAKAAIKTVAKEVAKDTVFDAAANTVSDYAKEKFNLNETTTTILNLGLSVAIENGVENGVDFAKNKVGIEKTGTFAEKMSFEDAKAYNKYWSDLENGTHADYPGMSDADAAAWNLADSKLNEHISVDKVDTDAVVTLRAEEAAAQDAFLNGSADGVSESGCTSIDDWINNTADLSKKSPFEIPSNATVKAQAKNGYDQITYKWSADGYNYEVRWHTKTPGAPKGQGNTWVVSRVTPGTPTGQARVEHILVGNNWIPRYQWQNAINAYRNGTATSVQLQLLKDGHWNAP